MTVSLSVGAAGQMVCAAAFGATAASAVASRLPPAQKALLAAACLATVLWAAAGLAQWPDALLVPLRSALWIAFLAATLGLGRNWRGRALLAAGLAGALALAALPRAVVALDLILAVAGLLLLENLMRNCDEDGRWGAKWLCLGLGALFVYDFYLAADTILTQRPDQGLADARGFVDALGAPLLMLALSRSASWRALGLSRQAAFHTAVLAGSGFYLLAMAMVGMVLRSVGDGWGPVFQAVFLAAAVLTMLAAVASGAFRSALRLTIAKHFFRHRYDYRQVWLSFIARLAAPDDAVPFERRLLQAVAEVFDCPGGALWVRDGADGPLRPAAQWNLGGEALADPSWDDPSAVHPRALHPRAWAVVPMIHDGRLVGGILLLRPRTPRRLGWEETDLLKTLGAQAASTLAERQSSRALAEARQFEAFNRRFAFAVHDVKTVVAQMALLVENAKTHGANPAFQRDMMATLAHSVGRLRGLLAQLSGLGAAAGTPVEAAPVDLVPLLARAAGHWRRTLPGLQTQGLDGRATALVQADGLVSVLDHLLQNAAEASAPGAPVLLTLGRQAGGVVVEVTDHGPGMDEAFVRDRLFKPLDSGKSGGTGLGAYQARQLIQAMGGRLDVDSRPGRGTTMRLLLPGCAPAPAAAGLEGAQP